MLKQVQETQQHLNELLNRAEVIGAEKYNAMERADELVSELEEQLGYENDEVVLTEEQQVLVEDHELAESEWCEAREESDAWDALVIDLDAAIQQYNSFALLWEEFEAIFADELERLMNDVAQAAEQPKTSPPDPIKASSTYLTDKTGRPITDLGFLPSNPLSK